MIGPVPGAGKSAMSRRVQGLPLMECVFWCC